MAGNVVASANISWDFVKITFKEKLERRGIGLVMVGRIPTSQFYNCL
ncbi:hypothetical protein CCACVL1_03491 [Corchorus capsularis]|uniref:Uncharacterized protein n=1 Tax=Corchorus capsularis TaxID=210143 RepID=A0A1R3JYU7_COCAP|nr:hypothetical protein CCACVL1_03491 [Corchorus capsularis]